LALSGAWISALVILVWGFVIIGLADILFRPFVSAAAGEVSFLLMLLSILGGAKTFGLVGVVVGPLLLGIAAGIWQRWVRDTFEHRVHPLASAKTDTKPAPPDRT
ncbi:MAG: AI-2E family transporter, partial [Acidiferrobacteraceae bacterium]